jgi:prevent-host-death family protein
MTRITVDQARARLGDLVAAAASGEEVVVQSDDAAVRLVPVERNRPRPRFGSAKGSIEMSDDFEAPLPDFREYTE